MEDYQLRYAAGRYWLLDMSQGLEYRRPIGLNESGAYLWKLFSKGMTKEEIAGHLTREFGLSWEEAMQDTEDFWGCIQKY